MPRLRKRPMEDVCRETLGAARDLARKGLRGRVGDPLPDLMSGAAVDLINASPLLFQILVEHYRQDDSTTQKEKLCQTKR